MFFVPVIGLSNSCRIDYQDNVRAPVPEYRQNLNMYILQALGYALSHISY